MSSSSLSRNGCHLNRAGPADLHFRPFVTNAGVGGYHSCSRFPPLTRDPTSLLRGVEIRGHVRPLTLVPAPRAERPDRLREMYGAITRRYFADEFCLPNQRLRITGSRVAVLRISRNPQTLQLFSATHSRVRAAQSANASKSSQLQRRTCMSGFSATVMLFVFHARDVDGLPCNRWR